MKINIGIVGYGNLGKAVEQIILSRHDLNLVAIFSRRAVKSKFNTLVENYENITLYRNRIDIMMLCGGSFDDLEKQTSDALLFFDCINTFDNHKRLLSEYKRLDALAKSTKHRLIMSCGWDPGIFSVIRTYIYVFSNEIPNVFWGKGISMGHSDAVRRTKNVVDGVEFTIPNAEAVKNARKGELSQKDSTHFRKCYVVADKKHHRQVEKSIKNIPDYFKGQQTSVEFVSHENLLRLKSKISHRGEIISKFKMIDGGNCYFNFKLRTSSNPSLTATIMTRYIDAVYNFKQNKLYGAFTPMDIPASFLFKSEFHEKIIEKLC